MATADIQDLSCSKKEVVSLLQGITVEGQKFAQNDPDAREKLLQQARSLVLALETPIESVLWMTWAEPAKSLATRVALDLNIFETLTEENGRPKTAIELAKPKGASPLLVNRIARMLTTVQLIEETGPAQYAPNRLTKLLTIPKYRDGIRFNFDTNGPPMAHMPEYLTNINFQNPSDPANSPFHFAHKSDSIIGWLIAHPAVMGAFHGYSQGLREDRPAWIDMYPVYERLIQGLKSDGDASSLVDVGGGAGHVIDGFRVRLPEWNGRLVLQELEPVIGLAHASGLDSRIEPMVHDFFTPQPIKGARVYYLRYILHDWPDDACQKILANLEEAMEPGYSKIIINECVVPEEGASWQHASLDMSMMALCSSRERTKQEWEELIKTTGLKIAGIWSKGNGNDSVIELVKK